ncbi:MAG TPA: hypothetical protein VIX73_34890 [Kofleriaceae bacterium]|jgi:hypothetical protein
MRTILLASLALGACASDPATPPPRPMPSARAQDLVDGDVPSTAAACLTRYTFRWLDLQIDCPTELVGGDPDHWVTSCAIPDGFASLDLHGLGNLLLRHEATAEAGQLLHELIDYPTGLHLGFIPWHDVSYVYDSQHRLSEMISIDPTGTLQSDLVIGPRDAAGNPLSMMVSVPPYVYPPTGETFPATAHITHVYGYDAGGRLITDQGRFGDGVKFWDETVSYDDAALRRDYVIIIDDSAEFHDGGGPGYNTRHEFLDDAGRLLEGAYTTPGDPTPFVVDNRYDGQSRLSSQIRMSVDGHSETIDYIYECH